MGLRSRVGHLPAVTRERDELANSLSEKNIGAWGPRRRTVGTNIRTNVAYGLNHMV